MGIDEVKPKEERLKESISLLRQILGLGIPDTEPAYVMVKQYLSDWVKSEDKHLQEYEIHFVRYGRKATLTLPWKKGRTAEFLLKKPRV